jgi:hypothetical protein
MKQITIDVSKKDTKTGKYVKQGEMIVTVPLIEDFVAELVAAKVTGEEDGMPVYDNDKAGFVQAAIFAYVKASARNKLISGTAEVKPGLKIAETWDELTAEGVRTGGAAALALIRELREAFADHVKTLGKSEAAQKVLTTFFNNKAVLEMATAENKGKMKGYIEAFAETLSEEDMERFARPLDVLLELCSAEVVDF